jgi:sugar O-acyltransferase (sialic acid O-acetyltransferase NeuD family)
LESAGDMLIEKATKKIIFWGATGHAKVLRECAIHNGYDLIALFDNNTKVISPFPNVSIYYGEKGFEKWLSQKSNKLEIKCLVAIGGTGGHDRIKIQQYLESKGIFATIVVHPSAFVADSVIIGKGSQVLAKSAVCVNVCIGESCIVNTGAIVDHDTNLGDGVHVGPGAHITGEVVIEKCSMIGAGATILPRIKIGENVIVGAGSVVTKDIEKNSIVYGNPARKK